MLEGVDALELGAQGLEAGFVAGEGDGPGHERRRVDGGAAIRQEQADTVLEADPEHLGPLPRRLREDGDQAMRGAVMGVDHVVDGAGPLAQLPPEVADAVLCFQGGNLMEESAHHYDAMISPTELGILRRGYDAAIDVVGRYYGSLNGPVAVSDARIVLEEFQNGFADPATASDTVRAFGSNYVQWEKVFAACQRVR